MDKKIGQRLKQVRTSLGISGSQMAAELDVHQSSYWNYENGLLSIKVEVLAKLYTKYNAMPLYICSGDGPMFKNKDEKSSLVKDLKKMEAEILATSAKLDYLSSKRFSD